MIHTTPDFTTPPLDIKAGVRPWRKIGYRLEGMPSSANPRKFIIHNYGHGGAGITLSWGVASQVRDLVADRTKLTGDTAVAVLGSGAIGLTAATLIRELGLKVTIYAREFWENTTSRIAGAQWAPSSVKFSDTPKFADVLKTAYTRFASDLEKGFGVSKRFNYTPEPDPYLDLVEELVPGLIPKPVAMNLPFAHLTAPGFRYETLLIETPIFLKKLDADLRANNVEFKRKTFTDVAGVLGLPENVIVNCTGLGTNDIWKDPELFPIKGHLALLKPQPALTYLFSRRGYLFPRADGVIIGGTYRVGDATTDPDPIISQRLVDHMKGVFGVGPVVPLPESHFDHPDNQPFVATELVAADV
jgi:D-amino-acid oxidase